MSKPVRILHLLDTDQFAGTEQHVLTLISALAEAGVENFLACHVDGALYQRAIRQGITVLPVFDHRFSITALWAAARGIRDEVHNQQIDILHAHNGRTEMLAAIVRSLCGVTIVSTQHFIMPRHLAYTGIKKTVSKAMHRWVGRKVDATIAVSAGVQQAVIEQGYYARGKISVILSGVFPSHTSAPEALQKVREEMGCAAGEQMILTAARLEAEKRIDNLIAAIPRVATRFPAVRFVIAGGGALQAELAQSAAESGADRNIVFTGFRDDINHLIAASHIFVLPSPNEPFGLVLLEAMAAGKPVIAAAKGGPLEIVEDGSTGLLFEPENAASLADKLETLLADPALRERMGRCGAERFASDFTAKRMAKETVDFYQRALASREMPSKVQ